MLLVDVRAGDPARALAHARIDEVTDAGGRLLAEHCSRRRPRTDVALHEQRVVLEVVRGGRLDLGGREGHLGALLIDLAVTGDADDDQFAGAIEMREGEDDVLERVRSGVLAVEFAVGVSHQRVDGRRVRGVEDDRGRLGVVRDGLWHRSGEGLDVRGVPARAPHERVLPDRRGVQELLAPGAAHRAGVGLDDDVLES